MELMIGILSAVASAGLAWCCMQALSRITYVTMADGHKLMRKLPLLVRLLLPFAPNFKSMFGGPLFDEPKRKTDRTLVACGLDEIITASDYYALRVMMPVVLWTLLAGLTALSLQYIPGRIGHFVYDRRWIIYLVTALLSIEYPRSWLRQELKARHGSIQRSIPFILDLLTLSVEAGMDFMSALQRIVERREMDPMSEELVRVLREIQLGKTRREALKTMSDRVMHPDLRSVTGALIQADEMGVSIGSMLRIQADQIRTRRFQRAETMAHEAPVKMLFPLIAFIFPAVFLVLLGPVFLEMARQWM